jgi:hypothetical protein
LENIKKGEQRGNKKEVEDNIKMILKGIGYEGVAWINFYLDGVHCRDVKSKFMKFGMNASVV